MFLFVWRRPIDASEHSKTVFCKMFYNFFMLVKIHLVSFQDFFQKDLLLLFNNILSYCKALNTNNDKGLLLDVSPKNPKPKKIYHQIFPKGFGYNKKY